MRRFLLLGFAIWLGGMLLLRFTPARLLPDEAAPILVLYAVSFLSVYLLVRRMTKGAADTAAAQRAVMALLLPTLVLDALTAAFFPVVYPNLSADAAGVFGGWMLICCGGGMTAGLRTG